MARTPPDETHTGMSWTRLVIIAGVLALAAGVALVFAILGRSSDDTSPTAAPDAESAVLTAFETNDEKVFNKSFADGVGPDKAFGSCMNPFIKATTFTVTGSVLNDDGTATVTVQFGKVEGQVHLVEVEDAWRINSMAC